MDSGAHPRGDSHLDRSLPTALAPLCTAGLITPAQLTALAEHAAGFPPAPLHKLFFEFEQRGDALVLAGYGHGFRPQALAELLADDSDFVAGVLGQRILAALRTDPFDPSGQRSRRSQDGEPEWIEYDVDGETIAELPGLFFALPPALRRLHDLTQVEALLAALAVHVPALREQQGEDDPRRLAGFLRRLGAREFAGDNPLRAYRIGLSENRAPGWLRLLIGGLRDDSLDDLASQALAGAYLAEVPRRNAALFAGDERSKLTASIDVIDGRLAAIDLEGPYLFQVRDWDRRAQLGQEFLARLGADGILPARLVGELSPLVVREVALPPAAERRGLLMLNHFKFGVAGRHRGRVKLYFELLMWARDRPGPRGWP